MSCWVKGALQEESPAKWLCERENSVESNFWTLHAGDDATSFFGAETSSKGAGRMFSPGICGDLVMPFEPRCPTAGSKEVGAYFNCRNISRLSTAVLQIAIKDKRRNFDRGIVKFVQQLQHQQFLQFLKMWELCSSRCALEACCVQQ